MGSVVNRRNIDIRFLMADAFSQSILLLLGLEQTLNTGKVHMAVSVSASDIYS